MVLNRKSALWQDFLDHFHQDFGMSHDGFDRELSGVWTWYSQDELAQLRERLTHCINADCHDDDLWPEWMDGPAQLYPGEGQMRDWFRLFLSSLNDFIDRGYKPD